MAQDRKSEGRSTGAGDTGRTASEADITSVSAGTGVGGSFYARAQDRMSRRPRGQTGDFDAGWGERGRTGGESGQWGGGFRSTGSGYSGGSGRDVYEPADVGRRESGGRSGRGGEREGGWSSGQGRSQESERQIDAGRGDYGRSDLGRADYGREEHGRGDYGRGDYGRGDYGRGDYGRADYSRWETGGLAGTREQGARAGEEQRRRSRWQKEPLTAGEIMTKDVKAVRPDDTLQEVARIMRDENTGVVPVVDENRRLKGLITDRDIVMRSLPEGKNPLEMRASDLMTDDVEAVTPDESLRAAVDLMGNRQVRRVPVVDSGDRLVGIISMADVANRADYDEDLQDALEEISSRRSFWRRLFG